MKALLTAVKAIERRRAVLVKRRSAIVARVQPLELELKELDQTLELLRPMAAKNGGNGDGKRDRDQVRAEAEKRWRAGQPPTQVARELEISVGTLYAWKKGMGWPKQPRG